MKTKTTLTLAAAALSGLLAGTASRAMAATPTGSQSSSKVSTAGQKAVTLDDTGKHACKGQNACKGQGGCKTGDAGCKGKNSCKGNGGCKSADAPTTEPAKL